MRKVGNLPLIFYVKSILAVSVLLKFPIFETLLFAKTDFKRNEIEWQKNSEIFILWCQNREDDILTMKTENAEDKGSVEIKGFSFQ